MKSGARSSLVFLASLFSAVITLAQAPQISSVSPSTGIPGTQVTIMGKYFGQTQGTGSVLLGSNNGNVISWSDTQIIATVASGNTGGWVRVFQTGNSNGIPFLMNPPNITSLTPTSGSAGTQVTFTGTGFGGVQGTGSVRLGSSNGTVSSWNDNQIVATVVQGSGSAQSLVSQNGVSSNGIPFYVFPPTITSVTPNSGVAGTQVTITGIGFWNSQGTGLVQFGGSNGIVNSWSDTQIVATVGPCASNGSVAVGRGGVQSNAVPFYVPPPILTNVNPSSGSAGTQVTLTGSGFCQVRGTLGQVLLGTLTATIDSWSDTQIVATIASGSVAGFAQVAQNGAWSNSLPFTATPPSFTVNNVSPTTLTIGGQVTIVGSGFGGVQGNGTVRVGSGAAVAAVVSWTDTQIVATVPAGTLAPGNIWVTKNGASSNSTPITVSPANITNVTPTTLTIGGQVTVTGSGFGTALGKVFIGSQATQPTINSWSDTQIVATVAPGTKAPGGLWVGQNGVNSNRIPITIATPNISDMTPSTLTIGGQVTITGSGFGTTPGTVAIGSQATQPTINSWSDTQIVGTVAPGTKAPGSLWVNQNGVSSNSIPITITPAVLTSVSPVNGVVGTQVTVVGSGFGATQGNGKVILGNLPRTLSIGVTPRSRRL